MNCSIPKSFRMPAAWLIAGLACVVLSGCAKAPPPRFHSNLVQLADKNVPEKQHQQIADILEALSGTPDDPFVVPESGLDAKLVTLAAGPVNASRKGAKLGLFREHCVHCHGITGDALGP